VGGRDLSLGHDRGQRGRFPAGGLFATLSGPDGRLFVGTTARQFVMLGLLGGFTTFSSFSLQTLALAQNGEWLRAASNIFGSVLLCLVGVWVGHALAVVINR
jgi:fluoride exporter